MKKPIKIALITVATLLGLAALALALVPVLFKGQIVERLRTELNERLDATVEFSDVDLSLLSTFPTLTAEVLDLEITGKGEFEGVRLFSVRSVAAGVDLFVLLEDDAIQVESIDLQQPEVQLLVTEDGTANYDIIKEQPETPGGEPQEDLAFEIKRYRIDEGSFAYDGPGIHVAIAGLDHRGRVKISGPMQHLASETSIEALTFTLGRITYVKNAKASIKVEATLETAGERVGVDDLQIAVNELAIAGSGSIGWADEGIDVDIELASKKGLPIKGLISAIPNAYSADFAGLKATGAFSLAAAVRGRLGPDDDDIPSFSMTMNVRNGTLKYPDLPLGVTGLDLDAKLDHPGGNLDKLRISVPKYGVAAGKSHAEGKLSIAQPLSQPSVDLVLNGRFDLSELAKAYPIPDVEELAGLVETRIDLRSKGERISKLTGSIEVADVLYRPTGAAPIRISTARVSLSPKSTKIEALRAKVGTSDISIKGIASPLTTLLMDDQEVTASVWLESKNLRVEDFLTDEGSSAEAAGEPPSTLVLPDGLDARLQFDVEKLSYGELVLKDFKGTGRIRNRKLVLSGVRAKALGGAMKLDGTVVTRSKGPATFDMAYVVDRASFAEAFDALPSMRAYAPVARFLDGRFSTDLEVSGTLGDDLSPKLESIDAGGLVATLQSKLRSDFKPLGVLHDAVPAIREPLDIESFRARFKIENGAVRVKPFTVKARGLAMEVGGTHGLNQEMRYQVTSEVPIDTLPTKLQRQVKVLGIDLSKAKSVGISANLTGSIKAPRVSVDVDTDALRGAIADTLSADLAERKARALKEAEEQIQKIIAEAEKRANQVRAQARRAAERARKEGYARADQVEREGKGNPFTEIAAREGAKRIRSETDKRADQAIAEAEKRADQMVTEARKRADQMLSEVAKRSGQGTDAVEAQITDRMR